MSIVITGNPGVGKHTIADEIAKKLELEIIDINKIAKESGLFEKNQDVNDVDVEKLGEIIKIKNSGENITVGHLAPYVLEKNQIKIIIILRRNPYDLLSVYKDRKYTDKKSKENAGSEILGIIAHDTINKFQEKSFQINISEKSIEEVVRKTIDVISSNKGSEEVDWLDLVTKNNDFKKFFVD
jgi:adenylate kinase